MILFYQPLIREGARFLDPDESKHCARVLRRKPGDMLRLTDGKGTFYEATITSNDSHRCEFEVISETTEPERDYRIHIAMSPTKSPERIDWFVEKAVETGIDQISFIRCRHAERTRLKSERLRKIAVTAMKQSLQATLPEIHDIVPFGDLVERSREQQRFIAIASQAKHEHLMHQAARGRSYCVLIGPEGDFSAHEINQAMDSGFHATSLGDHRLRTETAALSATHILGLINL